MSELAQLAAALVAFQSEMPSVPKTKTAKVPTKDGGSYSYQYADLPDVVAAAMPLLTRHGLSFTACPRSTDHGYELAGVLLHESGEYVEGSLPIFGTSPQQIGSSLTYGRRYLLGCLTGIVTDADDDGSTAQQTRRTVPEMTARTRGHMLSLFAQKGIPEAAHLSGVNRITGGQYTSLSEVSESDAQLVIAELRKRPDATPAPDETPAARPPSDDGAAAYSGGEAASGSDSDAADRAAGNEGDAGADAPPAYPRKASRAMQRLLYGELGRFGVAKEDREERLYITSAIVRAPVASWNDMTADQAKALIDTFASLADRPALDALLDTLEEKP